MDYETEKDSNLNIENNENNENKQNENNKKKDFYYYICSNCKHTFLSKLEIINENKFCIIDCRTTWILKKYKDNHSCINILSQDFNDQYIK